MIRISINSIVQSIPFIDRESMSYQILVKSISKHGLVTPISVRQIDEGIGGYEIIDGYRRYQACKDLNRKWIDANVVDNTYLPPPKYQVATKPIEYARQLKRMLRYDTMPLMKLSNQLGKSVQWIEQTLSLNNIQNKYLQNAINDGRICLTNAYAIAKLPVEEQIDWAEMAKVKKPDVFVGWVNQRLKRLQERLNEHNYQQEFYNKSLGEPYPENPCGEVTLTGRRRRFNPEPQFMPRSTRAKHWLESQGIAVDWKTKGINSIVHDEVTVSAYELLHGVQEPTVQIDAIKIREPLQRKGWDHVHGKGYSGSYAYCSGPWLVLFTGKHWIINHPEKPRMANMSFPSPNETMDFIEENFCAQR